MSVDEVIERSLWDLFWLPPWAEVIDRPELLYTRSERDLMVLNHIYRVRASANRVPALVHEVSEATAKVRSRWMVAPGSQSEALDAALDGSGWRIEAMHHAYAVQPETCTIHIRDGVEVRRVEDAPTLLDCIGVTERAFGGPRQPVPEDRVRDELSQCAAPSSRVHRFVAYDAASGEPLSSGGLSVYPGLGLGMLWGGGTVPEGRGRGAYGAVLSARLQAASRLGLGLVGVYARTHTSAPIVAHHGFERHGPMVTWVRESAA